MKDFPSKYDHARRPKNQLYQALINTQKELQRLDDQIQMQLHTEELLRESENRYRTMFELNPQPLFVVDFDTAKFLTVNRAAIEHYGYSEREFLRMTAHQLHPPEMLEKFLKDFYGHEEGVLETQSQHVTKNGARIDARIISQPVYYAGRKARLVISEDVTEKTRAERTLQFLNEVAITLSSSLDSKVTMEKVAKLTYAHFNGLSCVWHLTDRSGWSLGAVAHDDAEQVKKFQDSAKRFPLSPNDTFGPSFVVHSGKSELFQATSDTTLRRVSRNEGHFKFLKQIGLKSYMCVPMFARGRAIGALSLFSLDGHYSNYDLNVCEMLARRVAMAIDNARLYEQTRESAALIDTLFKAAPVGLAYVDENMHLRYLNDSMLRALRLNPNEEFLGKEIGEIQNIPSQAIEADLRRTLELGQAIVNREVAIKGPEDRVRSYLASYYPVHSDGQRWGLGITAADVTAQKEFESRLEDTVRLRDEFISIASHELKTPVTSLKLQMQFLKHFIAKEKIDPVKFERLIKAVNSSDRQTDRLSRLIQDLLDLSRIRTGRMSLEYEKFDFCEFVDSIIERYKNDFSAAGCALEYQGCTSAVGTWDRMRVEQAITNLLSNAMKYGAKKPISIYVENKGKQVYFSVRDRGFGIKSEDLDRIFHKFERAVTDARITGLGLGLYITQQIVNCLGGDIRVESEYGKGATFTIRLPLEPTQVQRCELSGQLLGEVQLLT